MSVSLTYPYTKFYITRFITRSFLFIVKGGCSPTRTYDFIVVVYVHFLFGHSDLIRFLFFIQEKRSLKSDYFFYLQQVSLYSTTRRCSGIDIITVIKVK